MPTSSVSVSGAYIVDSQFGASSTALAESTTGIPAGATVDGVEFTAAGFGLLFNQGTIASVRLTRSNGVGIGSTKNWTANSQVLGGPTDKWGALQADLDAALFKNQPGVLYTYDTSGTQGPDNEEANEKSPGTMVLYWTAPAGTTTIRGRTVIGIGISIA